MKQIRIILRTNNELTHDVPVTAKMLRQAGYFLATVFVLALGANSQKLSSLATNGHSANNHASNAPAIVSNHHAAIRKF